MFSAVRSQHSGVDICINNAGLARPDTLLSGSTSGWKDMFNVRALGPGAGRARACELEAVGTGFPARPLASCWEGHHSPLCFPYQQGSKWVHGHTFSAVLSSEPLGVVL